MHARLSVPVLIMLMACTGDRPRDDGDGTGHTVDSGAFLTDAGSTDAGSTDSGTSAGPCGESGICDLVVTNTQVVCSDHKVPVPLAATSTAPGTIDVVQEHVAQGCCPVFSATAQASLRTMNIDVSYDFSKDDCDCNCDLDVSYTLTQVPSDAFDLHAGDESVSVTVL
ncbi:MAG: hypothetical protein GXP62_02530 [Oligoflexia bacterium]|nr:hypothetical protein [Oligoflexia bacterium]